MAEVDPSKTIRAPRYPPFVANLEKAVFQWGDLRIEGYIQGKQVIAKTMSGRGVDLGYRTSDFSVHPAVRDLGAAIQKTFLLVGAKFLA